MPRLKSTFRWSYQFCLLWYSFTIFFNFISLKFESKKIPVRVNRFEVEGRVHKYVIIPENSSAGKSSVNLIVQLLLSTKVLRFDHCVFKIIQISNSHTEISGFLAFTSYPHKSKVQSCIKWSFTIPFASEGVCVHVGGPKGYRYIQKQSQFLLFAMRHSFWGEGRKRKSINTSWCLFYISINFHFVAWKECTSSSD